MYIRKGYRITWIEYGFSGAVPVVYKRKKIPIVQISYWSDVWHGKFTSRVSAYKMHPEELFKWYDEALEEYLTYEEKWDKHECPKYPSGKVGIQ